MECTQEYNRNMAEIRIDSVSSPFDSPELARLGLCILIKSEAMGLLPASLTIRELSRSGMERVLVHIGQAGLARSQVAVLLSARGSQDLEEALAAVDRLLSETPLPEREWSSMLGVFEAETLGKLVGVSPSSVRRYGEGSRHTPDDVGARLHFIAMVVAYLAGSYNEYGIRRWFQRRRSVLSGYTPASFLKGRWDPDDPRPRQIMDLARSLSHGGSA